jgi:DNA polymerase elongation subunit (family B)
MIDWDIYTPQIVAMSQQGLSSTQIADVLSKTTEEIKGRHDRQIRKVIEKWRKENNVEKVTTLPKILVFDIETSPMVAYVWRNNQKWIPKESIAQDWWVICWSAKWLFEDKEIGDCVTRKEARNADDKRVVKSLWKALDEADIVIAHNGDRYDIRAMNGRFLKHRLNLPSPYQSIDTYRAAKRRMKLSYYSLDYVADYLEVGKKQKTEFSLWTDCMVGKQEALDEMFKYCRQDVKVLEDVYLELRPYIQPHPNLGVYIEDDITR